MTGKRKLEFSDIASVEQPVDSASVHGVVSFVSPIKVSQRGSDYFNGAMGRQQSNLLVLGGLSRPKLKN